MIGLIPYLDSIFASNPYVLMEEMAKTCVVGLRQYMVSSSPSGCLVNRYEQAIYTYLVLGSVMIHSMEMVWS